MKNESMPRPSVDEDDTVRACGAASPYDPALVAQRIRAIVEIPGACDDAYRSDFLRAASVIEDLQATSRRTEPTIIGGTVFPRTKYLGELPFVFNATQEVIQVYHPDDWLPNTNPGPLGFIPVAKLPVLPVPQEPERSDGTKEPSNITKGSTP
jgi:hypothetical protein